MRRSPSSRSRGGPRSRSADAAAGVRSRYPSTGQPQQQRCRQPEMAVNGYGVPMCRAAVILDAQFESTMQRVESALAYAPRQMRARGEAWAHRLNLLAAVPQEELRRDRNLQAELLLQCLEEERWTEPLTRHPPQGPLPTLSPHIACAVRRKRTERERAAGTGDLCPRYHPAADVLEDSIVSCAEDTSSQDSSGVETEDPSLLPSTSESLAHTAARQFALATAGVPEEAIGAVDNLVTGVTAPPAYASLAARVAHLQDENRRLRQQLRGDHLAFDRGVAAAVRPAALPRSASASASHHRQDGCGLASPARLRKRDSPKGPFQISDVASPLRAERGVCSRVPEVGSLYEIGNANPSSRSIGSAKTPATLFSSWVAPDHTLSSTWPVHATRPPPQAADIASVVPPGPPPADGDVDGFLRYLDRFQAYTGTLCAA